jgi:hypothetical protein
MLPRAPAFLAWLFLVVATAACGGGRPLRPQPAGEQYLIAQDELQRTKQENLYDAIRQTRPFWFTRDTRRGGAAAGDVAIYLNEQLIGGLAQLRRIPVAATSRVRYLSSTEAQLRFGAPNGLRPAILVESERQ